MKRRWLITLLLCVVALGGTLTCRLWPRTLSPDQCGTVYRHYAAVEGVEATYIKDKHIGGDDKVDVTLLQATTDSSWHALLSDFDIPDLYEKIGTDKVFFRLIKKCHTEERPDTANGDNDVLAASPKNRTIGIFHITDKSQIKPIVFHQINKLKKTSS